MAGGRKKKVPTSIQKPEEPPEGSFMSFLLHFVRPALGIVTTVLPILINVTSKLYHSYCRLPPNSASLLIGFILCFFGGVYSALFSAIEAAKVGGWSTLVSSLHDLKVEAIKILEANKKDDAVDADKDGVADVKQLSDHDLLWRKINVVLTKCNPEKVDKALNSLYTVWISVAATLTIQFARTIALASAISNFMQKPGQRLLSPLMKTFVPDEYERWIPTLVGWICKSFAMSFAWYLQSMISAFASAVTGGLLMSRAILAICIEHDVDLGGFLPKKHEDTNMDEYLSYALALMGFYFQFRIGFNITFPYNILLFPCEIAEMYIRWAVTVVE